MTGSLIHVTLARVEAEHLVLLLDRFLDLLREEPSAPDPALQRLTPVAYPDDPDAAAAFAAATRADLQDRRANDARVVRARVDSLAADTTEHVELAVPADELDAWLRALTALRLVLAVRLGIEHDGAHAPEDPRFGVYDWLGYRLELLLEAADALDDEA